MKTIQFVIKMYSKCLNAWNFDVESGLIKTAKNIVE